MKLIDKDALIAEIEELRNKAIRWSKCKSNPGSSDDYEIGKRNAYSIVLDFLNTLEVKEVDLEKESKLIANGIMISVQSNKYGTNIYNTERNDFNHYHLQMAARKGIELGLKAQK